MSPVTIDIPLQEIEQFGKKRYIRRLSFFGSVVRDDFGPHSDIEVIGDAAKKKGEACLGRYR